MDENGNFGPVDQSAFLEFLATDQGVVGDTLLREWREHLPQLRTFLVGNDRATRDMIGSSLSFRRVPLGIEARLHCQASKTELIEIGTSFDGILECLENHIALKSNVWQPDYKRRRQERLELDKRGGGS